MVSSSTRTWRRSRSRSRSPTKPRNGFSNKTLRDRSYGARPLRRALQKYIEDPLSEALIQGTITTRPAFIEVFLEDNKLFYRPVDAKKTEGVLLYE